MQGNQKYISQAGFLLNVIKENLLIISMKILLLQITTLYSLETRLIMVRKRIMKNEFKGPGWSIIDKHTDVSQRQFKICEVAEGLIGKPRPKGIHLRFPVHCRYRLFILSLSSL